MMNKPITAAGLVLSLLFAAGCSPKADGSTFSNLQRFKGKAPSTLLADPEVGPVIRKLVPQNRSKCLDDAFNYMPDLTVDGDKFVHAQLDGSHASNFMEAYISAAPSGEVYVLLRCESMTTSKGTHLLFTNADPKSPMPDAIKQLVVDNGGQNDVIIAAHGQTTTKIAIVDFANVATNDSGNTADAQQLPTSEQAPATSAPQVQQAAPVQQQVPEPAIDRVAAYANNLADELERVSSPTCAVIANNIRMFGNTDLPAEIRLRQVESIFNHVPISCLSSQ